MKHYFNQQVLLSAISNLTGREIIDADHQITQLHGGTLGDVRLVSGMAIDRCGYKQPYQIVWKIQKKWQRPGDINSWRREYDLYCSELNKHFTDSFRWPQCCHMELDSDEIHIWMEYIDGISGEELSIDMLEQAAFELGRFQGRTLIQADLLEEISCLGDAGFMEREFAQWHTQTYSYDFLVSEGCQIPVFLKTMLVEGDIELHSGKPLEYSYMRSRGCDLADELKQMLINTDEYSLEIFHRFKKLPIVLCHRDFWIKNIFSSAGKIRLIDWDTAGWGYIGEDIASLIIDETGSDRLDLYMRRLFPAYQKGLSEFRDELQIEASTIIDMILVKFGYRILQEYMFNESEAAKKEQVDILQKLNDLSKKYSNEKFDKSVQTDQKPI